MAHWTREVTGATVVELARNLPLRALGSCSWKVLSLEKLLQWLLKVGKLLLAIGYYFLPCTAGNGNREDWSAERACQAKTLEPESTPLSNCNMFRRDQRISFKTDKPNNRSQNKGKVIKDIIKYISIKVTTKTKFQNFLNTKGRKISRNRPHRERDKLIMENTENKTSENQMHNLY